jgi:hypothetical protein
MPGSFGYVSELENGPRLPSREVAEQLDKALCAEGELVAVYDAEVARARNAEFSPSVADTDGLRTLDLNGLYDQGVEETKRRRLFGLAASAGVLGFDEMVRQGLDLTTAPLVGRG